LVVGIVFFVWALREADYGQLGSNPEVWLKKGVIDAAGNVLPAMLTYVTYHHQTRIQAGVKSNAKKVFRIRTGIIFGALAPGVLVVSQVVQLIIALASNHA
jgi:hypothetical protein